MAGFFEFVFGNAGDPQKGKRELLAAIDWELLSCPEDPKCGRALVTLVSSYGGDPQTACDVRDILGRQKAQNPETAKKMASFLAMNMLGASTHPELQDTIFGTILDATDGCNTIAEIVPAAEYLCSILPYAGGRADIQELMALRAVELADRALLDNINDAVGIAMLAQDQMQNGPYVSGEALESVRVNLWNLMEQAERQGAVELAIDAAFSLAQPTPVNDEIKIEAAKKWSGLIDVLAKKDKQAAYEKVCRSLEQTFFLSNIGAVVRDKKTQLEGRRGPGPSPF